MSKKKMKVSIFEIVWYSLCGLVALWGLTYITLGLIGDLLPVTATENGLAKASEVIRAHFGLGFLGWGMILVGIGAVLAIIVLLLNAKKSDKEVEKAARRAARLASNNVVDATSEPTNENPAQ